MVPSQWSKIIQSFGKVIAKSKPMPCITVWKRLKLVLP